MKASERGFTYIEMLTVITLLAMCFVPLLQMFVSSLDEVAQYSGFGTATQLGREAMEQVRNLRLTEEQVKRLGVIWSPPQKSAPLSLNHENWRVRRTPVSGTDPLEIRVDVFRERDLNEPVAQLVTLVEDL